MRIGAGQHASASRRARRSRAAQRGGVLSVVVVVVALAVVIALAALVRSIGAATVPASVGTVEVGAGESLSSIAAETAPVAPTNQVIDRIMELNDLAGAGVHVGQSLLVPQRRDG